MTCPLGLPGPDFPYRGLTELEVRVFAEEIGRRAAAGWNNYEMTNAKAHTAAYGFKLEAATHEEDLMVLKQVLEGRDPRTDAARSASR